MLLKTAEKHWYHVVCSCVMDWLWEIIDSGSERKICLAFIYFSRYNCYIPFMRFDLIMLTSLDSWLAFNDISNNGRPLLMVHFGLFWIWSANYCHGYILIQNMERKRVLYISDYFLSGHAIQKFSNFAFVVKLQLDYLPVLFWIFQQANFFPVKFDDRNFFQRRKKYSRPCPQSSKS